MTHEEFQDVIDGLEEFGADRPEEGRIFVDGIEVRIRSPRDAMRHRICLLCEDRKGLGLVLKHSVRENFGLPNLDRFSRFGFVRRAAEAKALSQKINDNRLDLTTVQGIVQNINDKVDDIKRALERIGPR